MSLWSYFETLRSTELLCILLQCQPSETGNKQHKYNCADTLLVAHMCFTLFDIFSKWAVRSNSCSHLSSPSSKQIPRCLGHRMELVLECCLFPVNVEIDGHRGGKLFRSCYKCEIVFSPLRSSDWLTETDAKNTL